MMLLAGGSVYDYSISKSKSMTKDQAKLARDALRGIWETYEDEIYESDERAIIILLGYLTETADASSKARDARQPLYCEATQR